MKKFISIILAFNCFSLPCYAAVNFTTDMEKGNCKLFGKVEEAAYNQSVSIEIKDKDGGDIHVSYAKTNNDGDFSYTFNFGDLPTGDYEVYIGAYGLSKAVKLDKDIFYANIADRNSALSKINDICEKYKNKTETLEGSVAAMLDVVKTCSRILEIDNELYADASSEVKKAVAEKAVQSGAYAQISEFRDLFNAEFACRMLMSATDANIEDVVNVLWDIYGFENCSVYDLYRELDNKAAVHKRLIGGEYSNVADVQFRFEQSVLLEKLYCSENIADAQNLYDQYPNLFAFSYNSYPNWTTRDMATASRKIYFKDIASLVNQLNTAYNSAGKSQGGSGASGGATGNKGNNSGKGETSGFSAVPTQRERTEIVKESSFNDMQDTKWAIDAVEYLYKNGIVAGNDIGGFEPKRNITREEFVTMIVNAFGLIDESAKCDFSDVLTEDWSYKYVASAASKGIVMGTDSKTFSAKEKITRQDMSVITKRAVDYVNKKYEEKREYVRFIDEENISSYSLEAVKYLFRCGILNGFEDGSFGALKNATRAEAAYLIYNAVL